MSESSTEQPRKMTILVYRRNHRGDPSNEHPTFGIHDCMGQVREHWKYDAVIGIGAKHTWPGHEEIRERVTWVGIGPTLRDPTDEDVTRMKANDPAFTGFRGKLVDFKEFFLWDEKWPSVKEFYNLYKYMFDDGHIPRAAKNDFPPDVYEDLKKIIARAREAIAAQTKPDNAETPANQMTERDSKPPTSCVKKRS